MRKQWIPEYEGLYEITETGLVIRHYKNHTRELTGNQNSSGYLTVNLSKNGSTSSRLVHRLVAEAFLANKNNKEMVDHIDECKTNNDVSNLRWCTAAENSNFYCTKNGRAHYIKLAQKRKAQLKEYERKLQNISKALNEKHKLLAVKERSIQALQRELEYMKKELERKEAALNRYIDAQVKEETTKNYTGHANTKGVKFKSIEEMVNIVGKKVSVNGTTFVSCGSAAAFIVKEELKSGKQRNKATISKELRRYLQGLRPSWSMYGKYLIY